jgi:hypothetical protein
MAFPYTSPQPIDAAEAALVLKVHGGTRDGERIVISGGCYSIGDFPGAGIRLSEPGVDALHCQVHCSDDGVFVEAAEPGMHVNGVRCMNWTLKTGDWITLGAVQLEVLSCVVAASSVNALPAPNCRTSPQEPASQQNSGHARHAGNGESSDSASGVNKSLEVFRQMGIAVSNYDSDLESNDAPDTGVPQTSTFADAPGGEDAGEIQQYMRALLQRVGSPSARGPDFATKSSQRKASPNGAPPPHAAEAASASPTPNPASNPAVHANIERHRVRASASPIDLTAMRALANRTAREAIHRHTRQTVFARVAKSLAVAVVSMACGGALAMAAHFQLIAYEYLYAGAVLGIAGVLLGFGHVLLAARQTRRIEPESEATAQTAVGIESTPSLQTREAAEQTQTSMPQ